ncbi:MAG: amidohydrolase family protein [Bacteroidota bacterium]|nr:amidohydrolase family protein [Bacteroidota bacterium]
MKKIRLILLTLFSNASFSQNTFVISDVHLIPISTNTILEHQDVYIKDGVIEKIEAHKTTATPGYKILKGAGKYMMPGLADMHVHLPDGSEPLTKQQAYDYYLQTGVTVLRSMRGEKFHPAHRDSIAKGWIKAPKLYISNPLPELDSLLNKKRLKIFIAEVKNNTYDFVKYINGVSENKMMEIAKVLKSNKIVIAGHVYKDLRTSIKLGFKSIEHLSPIMDAFNADTANFDKLLIEMKANNVSFCPTESFSQIVGFQYSIDENMSRNGMNIIDTALANTWKRDYIAYMGRFKKSAVAIYLKQTKYAKLEMEAFHPVLRRMVKADVNVLLSPDNCLFNVPGYAMLEEMKLYTNAGISNYDILKISTLNAANFFNESKKWGTLENGKDATLILLEKNPLENIENISSVSTTIIKGKLMWEKK